MKKVFLAIAVVSAFSFASCKKAKTCSCTTTHTSTTTNYDVGTSATTGLDIQVSSTSTNDPTTTTDETAYDKISKGAANAACPKTETLKGTDDQTYTSSGIRYGNKTDWQDSKTCTIK